MNKSSFICLITLIAAIYCRTSIVPIEYQTRRGMPSTNITNLSTVSCKTNETLVSCGIDGCHAIQGTYIDPNNPNTCIAGTSSSNHPVTAVAICGKFPKGSIKAIKTITSESQLNTQVLTQCPSNSILTGCQVNYQSGTINNIRGSYPGQQQSINTPPVQVKTQANDTKNQCIAGAQSDQTKIRGGAQCLETASNYELGKNFELKQLIG